MTESELHKRFRKEILPSVGSKLKDEGLITSHGFQRFNLTLDNISYHIDPDYTFVLHSSKKVPLEIVNSLGAKTVWGNVMVPYVLLKYRDDVSHFIFILTGYAAADQYRFVKNMAMTMEMLHGSADINRKLGIVPIKEPNIERVHSDLKETISHFR